MALPSIVESVNQLGGAWGALAVAALWQGTFVASIVALAAWALRRSSPALRYWLWQIVAIKLLILPFWTWSIGLPWLPAATVEAPLVALVSNAPAPASVPPHVPQQEGAAPRLSADYPTMAVSEITMTGWLFVAWAVVVLLLAGRLCVQRRRLASLLRQGTPGDETLLNAVRRVAADLKLSREPRVLLIDTDCSPFVCGIWRTTLVMPQALVPELDAAQLRQIVAHELAHLARHDLVWGWIPEIARMLFFFHPVMHWASNRIRLERELACDQVGLTYARHGAAEYADTVLKTIGLASTPDIFRALSPASLNGADRPPNRPQVTS